MSASRDWTRWLRCGKSRRAQDARWAVLDLIPEAAIDARALRKVVDQLRGCEWFEASPPRSAELAAALADHLDILASEIADGADGVSGGLFGFDSHYAGKATLRLDSESVARAGANALRSVADRLSGAAEAQRHPDGVNAAAIAAALAIALHKAATQAPLHGAPPCRPQRGAADAELAEWAEMRAAGQRAIEQVVARGEAAEVAARNIWEATSKRPLHAPAAWIAVTLAAEAVDEVMLTIVRRACAVDDPDWPCPPPPSRSSPAAGSAWASAFQSGAAIAYAEQSLRTAESSSLPDADGAARAALAQLIEALRGQVAAAKQLATEAIADTRALVDARRMIEQPLATENIKAGLTMLRQAASGEPLNSASTGGGAVAARCPGGQAGLRSLRGGGAALSAPATTRHDITARPAQEAGRAEVAQV